MATFGGVRAIVSRLVVGLGAGLGGANTIPALVPRQHLLTKALGVTGDTATGSPPL